MTSSAQDDGVQALERMTGHRFARPELLLRAVTHSSLAYENNSANPAAAPTSPAADNEQLEFLGDAVLGLIVAAELCKRHEMLREGDLTRMRAAIVSRRHLAECAAEMGLGAQLRLGRGEEQTGGRAKPALLSDALEAVVAALYLDGGLAAAEDFVVRRIVEPALPSLAEAIDSGQEIGDWKGALQAYVQAHGLQPARYTVTGESGPDHAKQFSVEVQLGNGEVAALGTATAATKKEAQQKAAQLALTSLRAQQESER